ncbi:DnaJ domain-containing protein [Adonisia turfae]|uniref:J domain-containing protein n=1 Tax=Adonisia turfae CCMR0081 TaxID=2292702 RepID=A0A6M0RYG8_9CYAN|nr:DnaJ domain-containing protein [Adonisia turfae]NEZ60752.1 hypothetical protein [Adonisia turfae CCMR0081]
MTSFNYYYDVLNLEPGSTKEDIKRAYRRLAQQWHPDKFSKKPDQLPEAREKFELIKEAYHKLIHAPYGDTLKNVSTKISVRPPSAEEHYQEGIGLLRAGKRKQAVESFNQAIRKRPNYLQAYQARAFTLEQLGLGLQAKADFEKVATLKQQMSSAPSSNPDVNGRPDVERTFQRGVLQFKSRRYGAAIEHFTTVIHLNPNHIEAYRYRSQAYFRRGYDDKANADFRRLRDLEQQAKEPASRPSSSSRKSSPRKSSSRKSSPRKSSHSTSRSLSRWQCIHTLSRHTGDVSAVAIARDGKKLVTGSHDKTLRLWSVKTGSLLRTLSGHSQAVHCVAVSWDGKLIASGSADTTIKLWDMRTGELLRSFGNLISGHSATVTALAFSPNNQFLVSTSQDATVRLWSLKSGKEIYALKDYPEEILALAMGWDGKAMVYGGNSNQLHIRHTKTGKLIRSFSIDSQPNRAVALSRQSSLLAVGSGDKIVMWNRQCQKKLFELKGHTAAVSSLVFSTGNQIVVSGSYDQTIKLWNASTGQNIDTLTGHQAAVCSVACSLDGKVIVSSSADTTVKIWQQT